MPVPKYAPAGFDQSLWMQARAKLACRPIMARMDGRVGRYFNEEMRV